MFELTDPIMILLTFAALGVSIASAIFTGMQWIVEKKSAEAAVLSAKAAEESAKTAREMLELSGRAWVIVDSVKRVKHADDAMTPIVVRGLCTLKNTGNSPAMELRVGQWIKAMAKFVPDYEYFPSPAGSSGPLGPGSITQIEVGLEVSQDDGSDIALKEKQLYLYGIATYKDIFRETHKTTWCLRYDMMASDFTFEPEHSSSD